MFQPTDELTMRLTVVEWNQIIAILGEQKYSLVFGLIQKFNEQVSMQHNVVTGPSANGAGIATGAK
jgi:hypothetical protein